MPATPPARPTVADAADLWAEAEPKLSRFLLRVLVKVGLYASAPFFALAVLFVLLQRPWWWALVPGAAGALVLAVALGVWTVIWLRLRRVRARLTQAAQWESWFLP